MHPRGKIPVVALLGLSCSQCTERSSGDPLIGEWQAIEIDGEKFPQVESGPAPPNGPAAEARVGWELHVAELGSTLSYFHEYSYGGSVNRSEYYSGVEVDDAAAPKYRLTIAGDLVHIGPDEPYTTTITSITGYDSDYSGTEYGSETGYDGTGTGGTGGSSGGLDEDEVIFDEFERDLHDASRPVHATALILDCELKAEQLHCVRQVGAGDDGERKVWTFARADGED